MEDFSNQRRRIIRPDGTNGLKPNFGTAQPVAGGQTVLLANYQRGDADGNPITIEGQCLLGSIGLGNRLLPFAVRVRLEISLSNMTYRESFPWPSCGWRRRFVAQQVKVFADNITDPAALETWTLQASVQHGYVNPQETLVHLQQNVAGFAQPAAWYRVPQCTSQFQARSYSGTALIGFGADNNPASQANPGIDGDPGAPSVGGVTFLPITQFYDEGPWFPNASVLWLKSPTDVDVCAFTFKG